VATGPVDRVLAGRSRLRASDADRERAIEALKVAFTEGRLSRDDLDVRVSRALLARTYADLAAATADMPARPGPAGAAPAPPGSAGTGPAGSAGTGPAGAAGAAGPGPGPGAEPGGPEVVGLEPGGARRAADWPPPALAAPARRQRANHWAFTCALGLATVALPVMMVAALHDRSQDLFCASIVLLMTYVMAMVVAAANVVAARFDDGGRRRAR
jgi:DUF1707 SHOCT-like domain